MSYDQFLEEVKTAVQEKLGIGYDVKIQKVTKNNGVMLDGLIISEKDKCVAPAIYLNPYYMRFSQGVPFVEIFEEIMAAYRECMGIAPEDIKMLLDFSGLRDKVVYKLIRKEDNQELLEDVPAFEFLDLAVVFYLILGDYKGGQMTALIHNSHMLSWGTTKDELYCLARKNTPKLLPPVIKTMEEVMREILKEHFDEPIDAELLADFFGDAHQRLPMYILSNRSQINGAVCILYDNCLEAFAKEMDSDVIILPSSTHEVLLIPDQESDYVELQNMVESINRTEVPKEDVLSDSVYKYERETGQITVVRQAVA